jgi:dienelactone hydrolase
MMKSPLALLTLVVCGSTAWAQADATYLQPILKEEILPPQIAMYQLKEYVLHRVAKPPAPASAGEWTAEASRLRKRLLNDVVFHGWPRDWVDAPPKFEDAGVIAGKGYRIRKLRYEIVPGFQGVALLYEPENAHGRMPGIVNVNGHAGPPGKSVEYKQKRCITFARHGIFALNLEWFFYGELAQPGNEHWYGHDLDLVGANGVGLFYLAMRKGLDYLAAHPNIDPDRLGVTGLSGGGWQTITLSSLDERVKVSVPVAGFSSIASRVEAKQYGDLGDFEQSATDMFDGNDFTHLTALRAPRPTLLIYNAEDDCCFRAAMTKPFVFDPIRPIFGLYGKQDLLAWHENRDPGTHNYQLDNRTQAYHFFSRQFQLPEFDEDADVAAELRRADELRVGLPEDNLTILGLARKLAAAIERPASPDAGAERSRLQQVIRLRPAGIERAWTVAISKHLGIESKSHLFDMAGGLSATGVWLKPIGAPDNSPLTIILDDKGIPATVERVANRLNRGEQVLAAGLTFVGEQWKDEDASDLEQLLSSTGERPLGVETAQLLELTRWAAERAHTAKVRVETDGMRTQLVALLAAALHPEMFSELKISHGMPSLAYVLKKPVQYIPAPDLFCLDLLHETDLDRLAALSAPVRVVNEQVIQ